MSGPLSLLSLPTELLIAVIRNLPLADVYRCERVCRQLRNLIRTSSDIQYGIALEGECYDDVPSSVGFAEKLEHLRQANNAWSSQKSRFVKEVKVEHDVSGIYDLAGGVYLLGDISQHTMYWTKLPRHEDDEVKWNHFKVPESIIDIGLAIDEHDLCAVVTTSPIHGTAPLVHEISMYFYQLSTGQPHPDAAQHRLVVHRTDKAPRPAIGIEIVGENLVLILSDYRNRVQPDDRVYVYEWKTTKLKMSLVAPFRTYSGPLILTEGLLMLPNTKEGMLEVWEIPKKANLPSPSVPFVILQLPTLAPGRQYTSISSRGEPNPVGESSKPGSRFRTRPYQASAENAIMIFNVNVEPSQNPFTIALGHMYTFFVHRKSLLDAVANADKRRKSAQRDDAPLPGRFGVSDDINISFPFATAASITVPWEEWGPSVTRWLEAERFPTRWITTTAGQRAVLTNLPATGGTNMLVFDFNPHHIRESVWKIREKNLAGLAEAEAEAASKRQKDKGKSVERDLEAVGEPVPPLESPLPSLPNSPEFKRRRHSPFAAAAAELGGPSTSNGLPIASSAGPSSSSSSGNGVSPVQEMPGSFVADDMQHHADATIEDEEPEFQSTWVLPPLPGGYEPSSALGSDEGWTEEELQGQERNSSSRDAETSEGEDSNEMETDEESGQDYEMDEDEDDSDAQPVIQLQINTDQFPHIPPGLIPFLLGHPNGLTLAQHLNDLQEATQGVDDPPLTGTLGHFGEVLEDGAGAMPGGWSETNGQVQYEEEGDEAGHIGLRTCVVFQKTQVDKYGRSFESPVVSHLPFVQYLSWIEERYEGVLMDEERLLGISTDERNIEKVDVIYLG